MSEPLPYDTPTSVLVEFYKARIIAAHKGELRMGDIVLTVTDTVVSEAAVQIVEKILEAEDVFAQRLVPRW